MTARKQSKSRPRKRLATMKDYAEAKFEPLDFRDLKDPDVREQLRILCSHATAAIWLLRLSKEELVAKIEETNDLDTWAGWAEELHGVLGLAKALPHIILKARTFGFSARSRCWQHAAREQLSGT